MGTHPEVRMIRSFAPLVLGCVLLGVLSALAYVWRAPKAYESSAELFVSARATPEGASGSSYDRALFAQERVKSYVPLVNSPTVMAKVISTLRLDRSVDELSKQVSVSAAPGTVLLTIRVRDASASMAQAIADATAAAFAGYATGLEGEGVGSAAVELQVTRSAELESEPVSPRPLLDVVMGAFLGGLVGLSAAALKHRWSVPEEEVAAAVAADPWSALEEEIEREAARVRPHPVLPALPVPFHRTGSGDP